MNMSKILDKNTRKARKNLKLLLLLLRKASLQRFQQPGIVGLLQQHRGRPEQQARSGLPAPDNRAPQSARSAPQERRESGSRGCDVRAHVRGHEHAHQDNEQRRPDAAALVVNSRRRYVPRAADRARLQEIVGDESTIQLLVGSSTAPAEFTTQEQQCQKRQLSIGEGVRVACLMIFF